MTCGSLRWCNAERLHHNSQEKDIYNELLREGRGLQYGRWGCCSESLPTDSSRERSKRRACCNDQQWQPWIGGVLPSPSEGISDGVLRTQPATPHTPQTSSLSYSSLSLSNRVNIRRDWYMVSEFTTPNTHPYIYIHTPTPKLHILLSLCCTASLLHSKSLFFIHHIN